jgi:hypothetical protein
METTPNEQEYQGRKIVVAPSYTDTGGWICGYSVIDSGGMESFNGYSMALSPPPSGPSGQHSARLGNKLTT